MQCTRLLYSHLSDLNSSILDVGLLDNFQVTDYCVSFSVVPIGSHHGGCVFFNQGLLMHRDHAEDVTVHLPKHDLVSMKDHARYKYLLHFDGNAHSTRLAQLLVLNSAVLKMYSPYTEFYYSAIRKYEHYIPFHMTEQDLLPILQRSIGCDSQMRAIMERGRDFARKHLNYKGMSCYWRVLFQQISGLLRYSPKEREGVHYVSP